MISPVAPSVSLISAVKVFPTVGVPLIVTSPSEFVRATTSVPAEVTDSLNPRLSSKDALTVITVPNCASVNVSVESASSAISTSSANHL